MRILEVKNLSLHINGKQLLKSINLYFEQGNIYAIVGPNGAGKSTLAYTIMGLDNYREITGDILYKGNSIKNLGVDERARQGITLAWQEPARFEGIKVKDFILAGAKEKDIEKVKDILVKLGMNPDEYIDRDVDKTLSGGERKKIEIASILAMEPELIIFDEPDSGIDVGTLDKIFEIIKYLKSQSKTVILITHSQVVLSQAQYAFLMCNGKILDQGPAVSIKKYFANKCIPCIHKNLPEGINKN